MGIVRDLFIAKKMSAGLKLPAPSSAALINRLFLAGRFSSETVVTLDGNAPLTLSDAAADAIRKLIQYGLCTKTGADIYCNRGKLTAVDGEVVVVGSPASANLYDASTRVEGYQIAQDGTVSASANFCYSAPIAVTANSKISAGAIIGGNTDRIRVAFYADDAPPSAANFISAVESAYGLDGTPVVITNITVPGTATHARLCTHKLNTDVILNVGQTVSPYVPFIEGECITVHGKNLFNPDETTDGKYIGSSGSIGDDASSMISEYIPVTVGEKYSWSFTTNFSQGSGYANGNRRMHGYKSDGTWKQQIAYINVTDSVATRHTITGTIPSDVAFVRLSEKLTDENIQFEHGDNATSYQSYVPPQTASVENLLSVGDTKDEQDIISGDVTRRCAACVYDGTQPVGDSYISTTGGKDVGAIIVYPLASPVTESVTPQPLNTTEGTNVVDVTAEVSPVALEVSYLSTP